MLLKSPGFTLVAVLSLSVGIGVNSTVFGFVNAILFKPLPVSNHERLVYFFAGNQRKPYGSASYVNYREFAEQNDVFSGLAAYSAPPMLITIGDHTEEINSQVVSGNFFSVLDVHVQRGRTLTAADDQISLTEPSVVISESFWRRRLNSEPEILGRQLILNGNNFPVVGIAPATFTGTDPMVSTDVWVPITQWATLIQNADATAQTIQPAQGDDKTAGKVESPGNTGTNTQAKAKESGRLGRDHNWLEMIGRLKPGISLDYAQAALATIGTRLQNSSDARDGKLIVTLSPASAIHPAVSEEIPSGVFILGLTSLILMICCVNVASLMLSRAAVRQKEFAIRIALGSSRRRLVRQLLTEALLLSLIGGILGLVFAYWTTRIVLGLIPPGDVGLSADVAIDQRVLWFSFLISVLTALIFGLLPALNSFRVDLIKSLGAATMSLGRGGRKINPRRALVVMQIVASLVLLISAGLAVRSFQKGQAISQNFKSDHILLLNLSPRKYGYSVNYTKTFYRELVTRIKATPGVDSVTLSNLLPLTIERSTVMARIEGKEPQHLQCSSVADGYFQTLKIPIVRGREFGTTDDDASRKVVIVNETMARTYWPGESPLGKLLHRGNNSAYEIVGVAKDSPYHNFGKASEPYLYFWLYQEPEKNVSLIIRTTAEPQKMITSVQREIKGLGANLPIFDFKTLDEVSKNQMVPVKAAAALLGLLSLIGLLVASIGIYGVTSYAFTQRRREIGIRMSLGAQRADILKLIMKEGVSLALVGIAIGLLLTLGTTHFVSSFLYGVSPVDPIVFLTVAVLLVLVALSASLSPAILAANSNPVDALRHE
jgi:predicted permease